MPDDGRIKGLSRLATVSDQRSRVQVISQCAAICVRQKLDSPESLEILLITSRDCGRWVIQKGWAIPKKRPHKVAALEAWEEAGVRGRVKKNSAGYYTYAKVLKNGERFPIVVQVHLLQVTELIDEYPESGQRELRWFSPQDAAAAVDEPELKALLRNTCYESD